MHNILLFEIMDTQHKKNEQAGQKNLAKPIPGNSPIRIQDTTQAPYCYSGLLMMTFPDSNDYIGTGILIANGTANETLYVLTCAHNLYSIENGGKATKVAFLRACNQNIEPFESVEAEDWYFHQGYTGSLQTKMYDYGLVKLKQSVRTVGNIPVLKVKSDEELWDLRVQLNGYGWFDNAMSHATGIIKGLTDSALTYPISTRPGAAGTAIMDLNNMNVVGIHTRSTEENLNEGVRITQAVANDLQSWMR